MKLIPIEGNRLRLDGGAMFGNAPKALWKKWKVPDEDNRIELATRCLLVQTQRGENILFECGVGADYDLKFCERFGIFPQENQLVASLNEVAVKEHMIDAVVLSHLHFDHAGGLLKQAEGKHSLLFPKAKYYVGKHHFGVANNPSLREKASFLPLLHDLLRDSKRLHWMEEDSMKEWGDMFSFTLSQGHTEGMLLSQICNTVFVADLVPGIPWLRPAINMGYDRFSEKLVDEKSAFLERAEKEHLRLFFTHDLHCISCCIKKDPEKGGYLPIEEETYGSS